MHTLPSSTDGLLPARQTPEPLHTSAPLQALPSVQLTPAETGVWVTPVAGLHESAVHTLPSSSVGAVPGAQLPAALHVSAPLHALPSVQLVPVATGVCTTPDAGLHESAVHTLPSSSVGGAPFWHAPAGHDSAPLQALPSPHVTVVRVPFAPHT